MHCSAVAAVEAPPAQVNIAKDVSELIGVGSLMSLLVSHPEPSCPGSYPVLDLEGSIEYYISDPEACKLRREYSHGVPQQDHRRGGRQDCSQA